MSSNSNSNNTAANSHKVFVCQRCGAAVSSSSTVICAECFRAYHDNPCKGCGMRAVDCHLTCPFYRTWKLHRKVVDDIYNRVRQQRDSWFNSRHVQASKSMRMLSKRKRRK